MPSSLTLHLTNRSPNPSLPIHAYITGLALQHSLRRVFVTTSPTSPLYFPESPPPSKILQPLTRDDVAIPLGAPGNTVTLTIPQLAGGRIWFSSGPQKLTFLLNPGGPGGGAALVEPSVLNPSAPNAGVDFAFCEFTLNNDQIFANISYVDFVPRLPVSLTLKTKKGEVQHVSGMAADGLERVCEGLRAQSGRDGQPWEKLVVMGQEGRALRALSPMHGDAVGAGFGGYFEEVVEGVWRRFSVEDGEKEGYGEKRHHRMRWPLVSRGPEPEPERKPAVLRINTQAAPGVLEGRVPKGSNDLVIGGEAFARPSTADILGCNSGPFTTGPSPKRNAIIPRLAAAFNRGSIAADDVTEHPSGPETFYRSEGGLPVNHYARIVHECNLDGKGYAFAYDDVQPDGGADQSGKVNAGDPEMLIVEVGGGSAYVGDRMP